MQPSKSITTGILKSIAVCKNVSVEELVNLSSTLPQKDSNGNATYANQVVRKFGNAELKIN